MQTSPQKNYHHGTDTPKEGKHAAYSVALLFLLCGIGWANWLARLPTFRQQLGLTEQSLGLLLLSTALGAMASFRVAGPLVARLGSRNVAIGSSIAFAVLLFFPSLATNPWAAGLGLFAAGAASGLIDVSINIQGIAAEKLLGKPLMATLHGMFSAGTLAGAASGTWAAQSGLALPLHSAVTSSFFIGMVFVAKAGLVADSVAQDPVELVRPRGALLTLGCIAFCSSIGEGAMADWVTIYLHDDLHTPLGTAGMGYVAFSVAMVIGRLTSDRLIAQLSATTVILAGGAIVAVGLGLGLVINQPWSVIAGATACGVGLAPMIPTVLRAASALYPKQAASALATVATLSYGGFLFGPPFIGFVGHSLGLRIGLAVVVAAALLLMGLTSRLSRQLSGSAS